MDGILFQVFFTINCLEIPLNFRHSLPEAKKAFTVLHPRGREWRKGMPRTKTLSTLVNQKLARSDSSCVKSSAEIVEGTLLQKRPLPPMNRTTVS